MRNGLRPWALGWSRSGWIGRVLSEPDVAPGLVQAVLFRRLWLFGPADGALSGIVSQAAYLGSRMEYSIDSEIGVCSSRAPRSMRRWRPVAKVALTLAGHGITLIGP